MVKFNSFEMNALVEGAWNDLDAQIAEIKNLYNEMHNSGSEEAIQSYYNKVKELKQYDKICKLTDCPEPYLSHYYITFKNGFAFLRGTGDWLSEDEMIIKRTKCSFDDCYQPDPEYDKWKDEDDNFFSGDKFVYKRLAWGERCDKIFSPDFLVTLK